LGRDLAVELDDNTLRQAIGLAPVPLDEVCHVGCTSGVRSEPARHHAVVAKVVSALIGPVTDACAVHERQIARVPRCQETLLQRDRHLFSEAGQQDTAYADGGTISNQRRDGIGLNELFHDRSLRLLPRIVRVAACVALSHAADGIPQRQDFPELRKHASQLLVDSPRVPGVCT
jgi:hypothetical protein